MDGEAIFGVIMMVLCGWGCAAAFYGIGIWAQKRKDPAGFWTGVAVDSKTIRDIPAYNKENARLWKIFSVPFWLLGLCALGGIFTEILSYLSIALLIFSCTVWIGLLVIRYKKIRKKYTIS